MLNTPAWANAPVSDASADTSSVVIIENDRILVAESVPEDLAVAILAVVSEDPSSLDEIRRLWPRYRTGSLPVSLESVPFKVTNDETLRERLRDDPFFVVLDLANKRLVTGPRYPYLAAEMAIDTIAGDDSDRGEPISLYLPPWWQRRENSSPRDALNGSNDRPIPETNRDFLYGEPLMTSIASYLLPAFAIHRACASVTNTADLRGSRISPAPGIIPYHVSVRIHRAWLMTPHPEIGDRIPRQLVHGGRDWIDSLVVAQQRRFLCSQPMVAAPLDVTSVQTAPMGLPEMSTYFDLCRHAIACGWAYLYQNCLDQVTDADRDDVKSLSDYLRRSVELWLDEPGDDGLSPRFIIECDRRRVPLGNQLTIEGIEPPPRPPHPKKCDCPICEMMYAGLLGPSFEFFDGHHLEIDNEFAFSMYETEEEWELNRSCWDDDTPLWKSEMADELSGL